MTRDTSLSTLNPHARLLSRDCKLVLMKPPNLTDLLKMLDPEKTTVSENHSELLDTTERQMYVVNNLLDQMQVVDNIKTALDVVSHHPHSIVIDVSNHSMDDRYDRLKEVLDPLLETLRADLLSSYPELSTRAMTVTGDVSSPEVASPGKERSLFNFKRLVSPLVRRSRSVASFDSVSTVSGTSSSSGMCSGTSVSDDSSTSVTLVTCSSDLSNSITYEKRATENPKTPCRLQIVLVDSRKMNSDEMQDYIHYMFRRYEGSFISLQHCPHVCWPLHQKPLDVTYRKPPIPRRVRMYYVPKQQAGRAIKDVLLYRSKSRNEKHAVETWTLIHSDRFIRPWDAWRFSCYNQGHHQVIAMHVCYGCLQRPQPIEDRMTDLDQVYQFAIELAKTAGHEIKTASAKRWAQSESSAGPDTKLNSVDLVTETDQRVEKLVIESIEKKFPSHKFIGEESYAAGKRPTLTDEPTWIVDPIDGTTNFVHGFPMVCISIGFCIDKIPTIGVVYNPFLDQLYRAQKGQGAFMNDTRLPLSHPHPAPLKSLSEALMAVEWGSLRSQSVMRKKLASFERLAGDPKEIPNAIMAHSLRSVGSAALNYCYVAAGQLDLYWEIGCYSWDVCAGVCIAREAGGKAFGKGGVEFDAAGLQGRHFFIIRAIGDTPEESGEAAQDRLTSEFHTVIETWDP